MRADKIFCKERPVSIVRVGLSQTSKFAEGYDAIFGKKGSKAKKATKPTAAGKKKKSRKK
jgi:hypothetical protein